MGSSQALTEADVLREICYLLICRCGKLNPFRRALLMRAALL
jgi:hypothetical protein